MRTHFYSSIGGDESTQRFFSRSNLPIALPSMSTILPHRLRRKFRSTKSKIRSRQSPTSSITSLESSFNPADTLNALRNHQWSAFDAQYLLMAIIGIFSLCVIQSPGPFVKTVVATLLMMALLLPITRQFFLPTLPVISWLVFFLACGFISGEYRPPIWVRVLPTLENILYGANLSNILSAHKSTALTIMAWIPYGLTHFGAPVVCSIIMFIFGPPGTVPTFARAFGYMNLAGVTIQLLFPCSPPWYENMYGLAPANYSVPGSPAGLAAVDEILGIRLYTSTFTASPMVFGAFPSLHSGSATIEALFMSHVFPKLRPLFIVYTLWLWWATMYLSHHYAVDLVGGSLLAAATYFVAQGNFLPRLQYGKMFRWDYDYVELGEVKEGTAYGLTDLEIDTYHAAALADSDEWTVGSSSSYASSRSPSLHDARSPTGEESGWDAETLAGQSDGEYKV